MRLGAVLALTLVVASLAAAPAAALPTDADCQAIPCPPFPPRIHIDLGDDEPVAVQESDLPVELEGTVTWRFDIDRYVLFAWDPQDPPEVQLGFEFVPDWLSPSVEPASYEIDIAPGNVQADGSDPTSPTLHYVHHQDITVRLEAADEPTPPADQEKWRPGLSAMSTESGSVSAAFSYHGIAIDPAGSGTTAEAESAGTLPGFDAVAAIAVAAGAAVAVRRGRH